MSSNSFSLREAQTLALKHMLNLNQTASQGQSAWKLLIFDDFTRDIISPLLNIGELREQGITLHMNINSKRLPVPDVPAIYFVLPSQSNVERICEDLKSNLYDQIHINFCGSVARNLLEQLADSALQSESVSQISKIHDQFLGFQSLSPSLFTLAQDNSYVAFNDSKVSDIQAQANIERCVEGLYAVLSTSSVVPIIRCARNGAAEMIARALSARLAENAAARLSTVPGSAATSLSSFRRPLLVLLERNVDLAAMLHHPWSYSALLHDALGLRLNRVKINEGEKEKTFDLDAHDTFWAEQAGATFPQVAMEVKTQLAEYTARIERLDALKGNDDANSTSNNENIAAELGNFVSDIPALQAKQAVIETHTSIATCLLKQIKARELDRFYALEEALLARGTCDRAELRHLLGEGKGTSTDRVRLLLVYYLCAAERAGATSAVKQEFETFEAQLKADGVDLRPLQYVRAARAHLNALSLPTAANTDDDNSNSNTDSNNGANWTALSKGYESLSTFTNLFAEGVDRLKSMLPQEQELPVTRIVRALMEQRAMKGVTEQYLYFDPQIDGGRGGPAPTISNDSTPTPFRQAVVFVVGGGNYTEYQNLLDYAVGGGPSSTSSSKRGNAPTKPKTIVYGSTELLNAEQFIQQMNKLS